MPIKVISDLVQRNIYSKPSLSVSCLYLLNDKRLLIVTKEFTIIIMTQDLKMVQFEIKTDGWVSCIAELPNNDIIAPNRRGTIQIFKLNKSSSKQIKVFKGHSADILSVIILDKSKFATSSYDQFIKIWQSTHPYNLIVTLEGHKVNVYSLIKIKHTNYFASGSKDMTVRFWNNISYETNHKNSYDTLFHFRHQMIYQRIQDITKSKSFFPFPHQLLLVLYHSNQLELFFLHMLLLHI